MSRNGDPEPDRPDVAVPVVQVPRDQALSDVALRVSAIRARIESQQTVVLKVSWKDSAGKDREPAELALSIPAAAKLADLLQQTVKPHLYYDQDQERWT